MNYTVLWRPSAETKLIQLWTESEQRQRVADAADEVDAQLKRDPTKQGESRWGTTRILTVAPLSVYFDVSEQDRQVVVWAVWLSG